MGPLMGLLGGDLLTEMIKKVKLPLNIIDILSALPEQGMGYQIVTVTLKNGVNLIDRRVINSTYLLLLDEESLTTDEINKVEIYEK